MYNYKEQMVSDIESFYDDCKDEFIADCEDTEDVYEKLYDELFARNDAVTGNASGSYTFNAYKAREFVYGNEDLIEQACREFCISDATVGRHFLEGNYEWFDVTIRCYLLSSCLSQFIDDNRARIEEDIAEAHPTDDDEDETLDKGENNE